MCVRGWGSTKPGTVFLIKHNNTQSKDYPSFSDDIKQWHRNYTFVKKF